MYMPETDEIQSAQLVLAKIQGERLCILYEDEDILAVNKPAGVLTHPAGMHYSDSLANQVAAYFQERNLSVCIRQSADWIRKHPESFCLPKIRLQHRDCRNSVKQES